MNSVGVKTKNHKGRKEPAGCAGSNAMDLGVCIVHGHKSNEEAFRSVAEMGFSSCQLLSWNRSFWTDAEAEDIKEKMQKYRVRISAFWCGWQGPTVWDFYEGPETLGLVPVTYRYARMKDLMDGSDFAKKLGVTDVATHMGFIPENPNDPNYAGLLSAIKTVAAHYKNNGQYLLFETGQETPVTLLRMIQNTGFDNLGINLDPANLILYGKANPVDALDVFGKYVRGVHAKDGKYPTDGRYLGAEVPIGEGKVDFEKLLSGLHALGYTGSITIEREIDGDQQTKDIIAAKAYLEKILATLD